ncbi:MAG: glycosyltransferase family 9 protein, partial [Candidatus Thorarchaeota archaeon]
KDYQRKEETPKHIHLTLLQGAGDILHLSPFIKLMKETYPFASFIHYVYGKFSSLSELETYAFEPGYFPNDLMYHQLKGWHSQGVRRLTFHHPPVAKAIQRDCIKWGWDKYDWMSMMCGVRIDNKDMTLKPSPVNVILPDPPVVGIHYLASSMDRTWYDAFELVSYFNMVYPNIKFVLFGGEAEQELGDLLGITNWSGVLSYHETAEAIKGLDALICVDSLVLHLSKLSSTPTLGLFGWSPASWSGPYPNTTSFIEADNMDSIKIERVIEWLRRTLKLR